jgi:hypothetical protein
LQQNNKTEAPAADAAAAKAPKVKKKGQEGSRNGVAHI